MSVQTTAAHRAPYLLALARVHAVERVSPSFVRITFGGDELDDFGTPGDVFDARIKIVFPPASGVLPALDRETDDWWESYLAVPEAERGWMRTYSIRELRVSDAGTEVVVDFVLHLEPGGSGPASAWAAGAAPGHEVYLVGPRRWREDRSGIEYAPGGASSVLLAGDETAAPAIARILEDAPRDTRGIAFIEVPGAADRLPIDAPAGVELHWLPRGGAAHGLRLIPTVLGFLGDEPVEGIAVADMAGDELVWETPDYAVSGDSAECYCWIAGESGVVTTLRRHLVRDLGVDRARVAFMGYWRRGVAMRG